MIYGYESRILNEFGLKQMKEISLQISAENLRELAGFLNESADLMEGATSSSWHRHLPDALHRKIGCNVIVLNSYS